MYTSDSIEFQFFDSSFILQLKPCPSGLSSRPMEGWVDGKDDEVGGGITGGGGSIGFKT